MIEAGRSIRAAARAFTRLPGHSPQVAAYRHASPVKGWAIRSTARTDVSPRLLDERAQERICEVRRHTGWAPRLIAGVVGRPHSTVHRTLHRHGISRRPRPKREQVRRYEWPCPGDPLHMDTKRYARFNRPGHAVTGSRFTSGAEMRERVGYEFCHSIVDDHSRLAYSELHPDERAETVVAFTRRALAFFEAEGIRPRRLMTDNAFAYTKSSGLCRLLSSKGIRHLLIQPRRPQTNGKVERFQQTMAEGVGLRARLRLIRAPRRDALLTGCAINHHRPHSSIGDRPPITTSRSTAPIAAGPLAGCAVAGERPRGQPGRPR